MVLTGIVWPKWRVWTRDVDRGLALDKLQVLSSYSGILTNTLESATLQPTARILQGNANLPEKAVWPWVLTLGSWNTKRRGGLQYCPACWAEETNPYVRVHWRFAWHVGCKRHGITLLDRCHQCNAPLEPHRLRAEHRHIAICATCKCDLRTGDSSPCLPNALAFQIEADSVLKNNQGMVFGIQVSASEWFSSAAFLVSLIRRSMRANCHRLGNALRKIGATVQQNILPFSGASIEKLYVEDRMQLINALRSLMLADTDHCIEVLKSESITLQGIVEKRAQVPQVLRVVTDSLPNRPSGNKRPRTSNSRIRSPHEVMRMMERLQRRLAIKAR